MGRKAIMQVCMDCNCEFETTGTYAKRCSGCRIKHNKEMRRERGAEYKARYRAKKRKEAVEKGEIVDKGASLKATMLEAKTRGLSYGKLQALRYMEQQKGILNG